MPVVLIVDDHRPNRILARDVLAGVDEPAHTLSHEVVVLRDDEPDCHLGRIRP